jgi:hypothetical protein
MTTKTNLAQPSFNSTGWNTPLNSNFNIANLAFGETVSANVASGNVTLSSSDAQNQRIAITGSPGVTRTIFLPNGVTGSWIVTNGSNATVTVKSDGGGATGTNIVSGYTATVFAAVSGASVEVFSAESDRVNKSGDTMVGTLNLPSNGLNVGSGQLQVTGGNVTTSGQFTASNNVTAYSDERLKENIKPIERALNRVNAMRGVTFNTKKDGTPGVGFIAQEIKPLIPEAVYEDYAGYLHVAYGNITALLVNAINELTERVEKLENKG